MHAVLALYNQIPKSEIANLKSKIPVLHLRF